ncbi:hypothetical protein [Nonomuraea sp. NPDC049141]|uniref:RICIN domain-containing protein n=1 Tax=Nonomuraea sp. NPDC049141 TaxID=3155500 RepID=UPI0033F917FF
MIKTLIGALAVGGALLTAAPANAATYIEFENDSSAFDLVMSATSVTNGASVGLATDNNATLGQWREEIVGTAIDGLAQRRFVLRASEGSVAGPLCLAVNDNIQPGQALGVKVATCNTLNAQRWTLHSGGVGLVRLRNEKYRTHFIARVSGSPEFITPLQMTTAFSGSTWVERASG